MEAMKKNMPEFEELTATLTANGLEEEASDKAYLTILLKDTEEQKKVAKVQENWNL